MPGFPRGAVVARGKRFGVVWHDATTALVLFPIERGRAKPHDVALDDTIACGFAMQDARIRVQRRSIGRTGQQQVGTVPGHVMCQVVQALVRFECDAAAVAKWAAADVHRRRGLAESLPATR